MNSNEQKLVDILGKTVLFDEPLAKYSSFKIGGPAKFFYRAKNQADLVLAISKARELAVPVFVLGGGTNLLVSDRGFSGLVVKNDTSGIKLIGMKGKKTGVTPGGEKSEQTVYISAESGVSINRLVRFCLDQGFSGLEFFLGQPGTVGGATYINAHNMRKGMYWGDRIVEVRLLKRTGQIETVPAEYFHFGYDRSILQKSADVVLSVVVSLKRGDKTRLWQDGQEALEYRQKTQPTGVFSSGCTFRNISKSEAITLSTPGYTTSAGYLLDSVGLKGLKSGEAQFSPHHANFIVHRGKVMAADVLKLINLAKRRVKDKYNIDLQTEIVLVGEFQDG